MIFRKLFLVWSLFLATTVLLSGPAHAKKGPIPLTVQVLDGGGEPIITAVVRHPGERERHRVNHATGAWTTNALYLPGGDVLKFDPGMEIEFEVTAPGYISETIRYIVRKRKNVIEVTLQPMDLSEDREGQEDPIIAFGRDKPID
ncbi:MAG: hypothetical protein JRI25_03075 [Deltaproteobacteria bacterium]|nr:hypothetical protein [Deltaproteobacteria bacterium]